MECSSAPSTPINYLAMNFNRRKTKRHRKAKSREESQPHSLDLDEDLISRLTPHILDTRTSSESQEIGTTNYPCSSRMKRRLPSSTPLFKSNKFSHTLLALILVVLLSWSGVHSHKSSHHLPHRGNRASETNGGSSEENLSSIEAVFSTGNASIGLQHQVYNLGTDVLYVGGTNRLYELNSESLEVSTVVETGPRFDSARCHASGCGSDNTIRQSLSNNINKVLVLDSGANTLIMCGSVSQGACHKFRTANISLTPEYIPRAVAANDPDSSTYAFVGPERYNSWGGSEALYVGTTFTRVGDYRNDVPAVSTRNLYDLDFAEYTFSKQSLLRIDVKYRDHFLVRYVYGFNASDYAYFVTVQKKSHLPGQDETGYISRLARSCITDANYESYTEITLSCQGRHGSYNLVQDAKLVSAGAELAASMGIFAGDPILVATFAPSRDHTAEAVDGAAVCVYSMKYIEAKFNENIHMCFNGSMHYRNMEYVSGLIQDGKCPDAGSTGNIYNFCEVALKISGTSPARANAALEYDERSMSAIQSTTTGAHTVLFLGTRDGYLIKALLSGSSRAFQYSEEVVHSGSPIHPDMPLDSGGSYLYLLTSNRVSKFRVERCVAYTTCDSCLQARDPYCGWCSLEKRCTVASACQKAEFSSPRWLSFGAGQQCLDFEMIRPDRLPLHQQAMVKLTIRTLPELPSGAKYQCVWGNAPPSDAQVVDQGLKCLAPPNKYRPSIPPHTDHTLVPLAVRSSETNKDFVSRNFAFYDCSRHTTCGSCVKSAWACNWCVYENVCAHNSSTCGGTVVSGENVSIVQLLKQNRAQLASRGPGFCPRFYKKEDELLAPDGASTELSLSVRNLPVPKAGQSGFQCVVSVEGATMLVAARVLPDASGIVICESTVYRYQAMTGVYEARLTLVWNRDHVVDSRSLTLYKCGVLGAHRGHADCSLCVTRPERYRCSWCGGACHFTPSCPGNARPLLSTSDHTSAGLLPVNDQCPTPRIDMIYPLAGPIEGGTLVTIEGSNLGLREEDIHGNVFIGDIPCKVMDYEVSVKIICRTAPADVLGGGSDLQYPVRVTTSAGNTTSTVKFTYTDISVTGVWPSMGPVAGGTTLSISGRYLNVGTEVSAFLDNLPCIVNKTQSSSQRLVCVTTAATLDDEFDTGIGYPKQIRTLTVTLDGASRTLRAPYTYTPDPRIVELKPLRSSWDGGRLVTVHGSNLNSIQTPRITVLLNEQILNSSQCYVHSPAIMECPSPILDKDEVLALIEEYQQESFENRRKRQNSRGTRNLKFNQYDEVPLDFGFIMDGVGTVQHLRKHFPEVRSQVTYVKNPTLYPFPNGIYSYQEELLVIEGENINLAADESDVQVSIGTSLCNLTSVTATQVMCVPPEDQPSPTDERGMTTPEMLPLVVVHIGRYQRYPLGVLRYERYRSFPLSPAGIAGIAGGALLFIIGLFIVLALYIRRTSQADRDYKLMRITMDKVESNVQPECKQAFAELQTDMTGLTADLQSTGIPTWDLRTYIMKFFFPGVTDHPILNEPQNLLCGRSNYDVAMLQLEQLLMNKHFLVTLVETLEAQKTFCIRDKVNVGSLLSILLLGRMEYLTEILRLLLHRLVENTSASKHPHLMLRKTETVVEKMLSNWLAATLYPHLKDKAGSPLFLLYMALKRQTEKGPVDSVTHEAKYCLSVDKLLKDTVTHSTVTIHLLHDEPHYEKIPHQTIYSSMAVYFEEYEEKVQIRVLDCDTISQVKTKILDALYRNTAYSIRPSVHDLTLEWRQGRGGRVILSDYDSSTEIHRGERRVNTLHHYGVKETAVMAILPIQNDATYSTSTCSGQYSYVNTVNPFSGIKHGPTPFSGQPDTPPRDAHHLVKRKDTNHVLNSSTLGGVFNKDLSSRKSIPEAYLTRLLTTKGTVQSFVDDFFRMTLSPNDNLPPPIKWLFDLLDSEAEMFGVGEADTVHAWKSNCLLLRFWVNFIKNPDFIFDINKSKSVEASLAVIAETFIESCTTSEQKLCKDSPSNKLLFSKEIQRYKTHVANYFSDIQASQPVSDQELGQLLQQLSSSYGNQFNNLAALKELYMYINKYQVPIIDALHCNAACNSLSLAQRLRSIICVVEKFSHSGGGPMSPLLPSQHLTSSPTHHMMATLPHNMSSMPHSHGHMPSSSSQHHIVTTTTLPHSTCGGMVNPLSNASYQHQNINPQHNILTTSPTSRCHMVEGDMTPLHHMNPSPRQLNPTLPMGLTPHHQYHGSSSSSQHTLPSNSSSQLSEL